MRNPVPLGPSITQGKKTRTIRMLTDSQRRRILANIEKALAALSSPPMTEEDRREYDRLIRRELEREERRRGLELK